ncbi:RagB/SusD family nutrient uptake outer membrane protein [Spirosoma sp.]
MKAETSFARNPTIQPFHILLPIPQNDLDANPNLTQNPGY